MTFASKGRKSSVDVVGCIRHFWHTLSLSFIVSHTHTLTESHIGPPCMSFLDCLSHTKHCVCNTKQFLSLNSFLLPPELTDLILNSAHSWKRISSSSDSVVTGLWSQRKIVVSFRAGARAYSILHRAHKVSCLLDSGAFVSWHKAAGAWGSRTSGAESSQWTRHNHIASCNVTFCCLSNSKDQNPLESNSSWVFQEIPRSLWNTTVHFRVHKILPLIPILFHITPFKAILF
jgi:hypothetical protein